jgi:putative flavoprotein involved in K+ transport
VAEQTVIVGAGPAGLAAAAVLGQQGREYSILERADSVGAAWRGRYDSLQLHTARWLSALPGAPLPRRFGRWVGRDDLVRYLEVYARRFGISPEFGVDVTRIERDPEGWRVETSTGTRTAASVVLATGYTRTPYVPDWPGLETFPGQFGHATEYREPSPYRGRRVLVVGAGNSASEIAVEVAGVAARVQLSVRTPPNIIRRDVLGVPSQVLGIALRRVPERLMNPLSTLMRKLTVPDLRRYGLPAPSGDGFSQFLRSQTVPILDHGFVQAVRSGRIRVVPAVSFIRDNDVHLVDGAVVRPDAIIAATGYRPDLDAMLGNLGVLDTSGQPLAHGANTVDGAPGLYFVGISVQLAGLLREIGREAEDVARHLRAA